MCSSIVGEFLGSFCSLTMHNEAGRLSGEGTGMLPFLISPHFINLFWPLGCAATEGRVWTSCAAPHTCPRAIFSVGNGVVEDNSSEGPECLGSGWSCVTQCGGLKPAGFKARAGAQKCLVWVFLLSTAPDIWEMGTELLWGAVPPLQAAPWPVQGWFCWKLPNSGPELNPWPFSLHWALRCQPFSEWNCPQPPAELLCHCVALALSFQIF